MNKQDPKLLFEVFCLTVAKYRSFQTISVPFSGYDCWEHDGMHDPPKIGPNKERKYNRVLGRKLYEIGFNANGFLVQVDLLRTPKSEMLTAVFLRSKDFPKGRNNANATFKFRKDQQHASFVIDFTSPPVKKRIAAKASIPKYLTPCNLRSGRLLLPCQIDNKLVHQLLLATDFAGQAAEGILLPRDPKKFYPPA